MEKQPLLGSKGGESVNVMVFLESVLSAESCFPHCHTTGTYANFSQQEISGAEGQEC